MWFLNFGSKKDKTQKIEKDTREEDILFLIKSLSSFECDESHVAEVQDFDEKIENIYKKLIISLLNGNFLKEDDYNAVSEVLRNLITDFDNKNMDSESNYIKMVKSKLQPLLLDLKLITLIKVGITNKRKIVHNLDPIPEYSGKREDYMKLLSHLINILSLESHIVEGGYGLITSFASIYDRIDNITFIDESFKNLQNIIKERINFNLYKLSIVHGKDRIRYYKDEGNEPDLGNIDNESIFLDIKKILSFLRNPESNLCIQENEEKKKLEDSKFGDRLALNKLTTYYKGSIHNIQGLEWIINEYGKVHELNPSLTDENYINYVYIQNNYLSLLIRTYEKDNRNRNIWEIDGKIDKVFNTLTFRKKKANFRDYFTYFKYAKYKYLTAKSCKYDKDLQKAKQCIKIAVKAIEDAIDIFYADDFYEYFEYDIQSNTFDLPNGNDDIDKLYVCNLYCLPFDFQAKLKELEDLQNKITKLEIEIINDEKIETVDKKINDYKVDIMTVVGIFTAIVVYSFGTIQIFSIIENIGDAIMFSGIFLSGILLLLFGVFLYKEEVKKAKYIFIVSMVVLALSIVGRYFLKDSPININKGENTNSKLENSIYKATLLEESLEKMLKESSYNAVNECEIKDN